MMPKRWQFFSRLKAMIQLYPDGLITTTALEQLDDLTAKNSKPFFLAVGIIRPHLPFGAPARYMEPYRTAKLPPIPHPQKPEGKTTWHNSGEFMKYQRWGNNPNTDADFATQVRKHYAACVSYADAQVGRILQKLEDSGAAKNTIVILWGDHGWHLGEHAVWGKHTLFEESLRAPLIVSAPQMAHPGASSRAVVEAIDIFPTLCDLTALPRPDFVQGQSLLPLLQDPTRAGHVAISYAGNARTIRTATHRLISHKDGHIELYDHTAPDGETTNLAAQQPARVQELLAQLNQRLKP